MNICIPTETDAGKTAKVFDHFGSAPYFTMYDTVEDIINVIPNGNQHHIHGTCDPMSMLKNKPIDAVICKGMGGRVVQRLNGAGIRTYLADGATVIELIRACENNQLKELNMLNCCSQHNCH